MKKATEQFKPILERSEKGVKAEGWPCWCASVEDSRDSATQAFFIDHVPCVELSRSLPLWGEGQGEGGGNPRRKVIGELFKLSEIVPVKAPSELPGLCQTPPSPALPARRRSRENISPSWTRRELTPRQTATFAKESIRGMVDASVNRTSGLDGVVQASRRPPADRRLPTY